MPRQRYRCENGGALCAFALNRQLVEMDAGVAPPCGIANCSTESAWLIPVQGKPAGQRIRLYALGVVLALAGLCAGAYIGLITPTDVPDRSKAGSMIHDFYPDLPGAKREAPR
jgi:hypothetical protein